MSKEKGLRQVYEKMLEALDRWLNEPTPATTEALAKAENKYRTLLER